MTVYDKPRKKTKKQQREYANFVSKIRGEVAKDLAESDKRQAEAIKNLPPGF